MRGVLESKMMLIVVIVIILALAMLAIVLAQSGANPLAELAEKSKITDILRSLGITGGTK